MLFRSPREPGTTVARIAPGSLDSLCDQPLGPGLELDVQHDRHGAVVHESEFHLCPEDACFDADTEPAQLAAEALVQRLALLRRRGAREARPVAFRRVV